MIVRKTYKNGFFIDLPHAYEYYVKSGWYADSEKETQNWMIDNIKKDWVCFDIGAHIGYYAMLMSSLAPDGMVYAFEPCRQTFQMAVANIRYNSVTNWYNFSNISMRMCAVGDADNVLQETLWLTGTSEDGLGKTTDTFEFLTVDTLADEYELSRLDLIKSDTDGWEIEVLLGARKTIERFSPIIVIESNYALGWRGHTQDDMLAFLKEVGYAYSVLDAGCPSNWLCYPENK